MPKSDHTSLKHDLAARLLLSPDDACEDIRRRYPDVCARAFGRYLNDSRACVAAPASPPWPDDETGQDTCPIAAQPPAVGDRICARRVEAVFQEAWCDAAWMRQQALRPDGSVANLAWLPASISARLLVTKLAVRQHFFEDYRDMEAQLQCFLTVAQAQSPQIGELCRRWVQDYDGQLWMLAPYDGLDRKLEDILLDAHLTRPREMGGGARHCGPAQVLMSIKFRLRWIRRALKQIDIFWGHGDHAGFWPSLIEWALSLEPDHRDAVWAAANVARANSETCDAMGSAA